MMKNLKNKLAALAFATAALGAFAFSPAKADQNLKLFGNLNGQWVEVTGSYRCLASSEICVARFENNDPQHGQMVESSRGRFIQ
ncbi:DUF6520 family protein [Nafulsella turpanensis]|uniref:DUF6520 family protein n=1 Tax=Nafulsella turpanensis TaxID=1265690 RepID=UPI00034C2DC2|nr:DUF6520 family protein [Nafulsella turpanensis]